MITPGLEQTAQQTVTADMTAAELGSGDLAVLGTPAVLALVERVAVTTVTPSLEPGTTTVGIRVELDHVAPTPVGSMVSASARLEAADPRRLTFSFEVSDAAGPVARGTHVRAIVVRDEFLARAEARTPAP
jgi:fluoroacetyl-CoA thioesterase